MLSLPDSSLLRAYRRRSLSQRVHWPTMCNPGGTPGALGSPPPPRTVVTEQVRDEILTVTLTRPPEELGITYWSSRLLADWLRRSGTAVSHDSISRFVAPVRDPALAVRDVQVLHRPRARSQGPRRRRPVPQPAPRRCSRCAPTSLSGRPMTITGTAPPPCSPRSR
jgi:hypothetical protein